jgi:hypothetical protein
MSQFSRFLPLYLSVIKFYDQIMDREGGCHETKSLTLVVSLSF